MKKFYSLFLPLVVVLLVTALTVDVKAQLPKAGKATTDKHAEKIVVKKLLGLGKQYVERTPRYADGGKKPPAEWIHIQMTYDTEAEWIDDMTVQFFVITQKMEDGKRQLSIFKTTVNYVDIEKGRDHVASVFLRPAALKRYGTILGLAVEVSIGGQPVAEKSEEAFKQLPEKWWKEKAIVDGKDTTFRDGYLLARSKTPFAMAHIDDYEVEK